MRKQEPRYSGSKTFYIVTKHGPDDVSLWETEILNKDIKSISPAHYGLKWQVILR